MHGHSRQGWDVKSKEGVPVLNISNTLQIATSH